MTARATLPNITPRPPGVERKPDPPGLGRITFYGVECDVHSFTGATLDGKASVVITPDRSPSWIEIVQQILADALIDTSMAQEIAEALSDAGYVVVAR